MRLIKLNTRLGSDGRAVVYSEWSKNFPELNGYLTSPENVYGGGDNGDSTRKGLLKNERK